MVRRIKIKGKKIKVTVDGIDSDRKTIECDAALILCVNKKPNDEIELIGGALGWDDLIVRGIGTFIMIDDENKQLILEGLEQSNDGELISSYKTDEEIIVED